MNSQELVDGEPLPPVGWGDAPLVVHGADRATSEDYELAAKQLRGRLKGLPETPTIPFRCQNGGDYDSRLELRSDIARGQRGPQIHLDDAVRPSGIDPA